MNMMTSEYMKRAINSRILIKRCEKSML